MKANDKGISQMNLRMDHFLHRRIKAAAALEGVTMQAFIEGMLRTVIGEDDDEEPKREDKPGKKQPPCRRAPVALRLLRPESSRRHTPAGEHPAPLGHRRRQRARRAGRGARGQEGEGVREKTPPLI